MENQNKENWLGWIVLAICAAAWLFSGCRKDDPPPAIFGKWETIGDPPFNYHFEITDQTICRRLPQVLGKPECFDSRASGDTLFVSAAEVWSWQFDFKAENVALVKNLKNNGGNPAEFVLVRK